MGRQGFDWMSSACTVQCCQDSTSGYVRTKGLICQTFQYRAPLHARIGQVEGSFVLFPEVTNIAIL